MINLNNDKVKFDPNKTYNYVEIADINSAGSEIINSEPILGQSYLQEQVIELKKMILLLQ